MKCTILHDLPGRLRVHLCCGRMSLSQADVLEYYLLAVDGVHSVKVYDWTQDAVVLYDAERGSILRALARFSFAEAEAMELVPEHTSRALNREFEDKLAIAVMRRCISKLFLPAPITTALALLRSVKYIREGLSALWHGKLSVAVLDATAVTVSMARGDFATAGSVMFMLHLGEILEEWTHKKSVADLASAMSLRVDSVWQQVNGAEVLTKITDVKPGDRIVIRTGGMIPLDGRVVEGETMVNQSSLTGESMPVAKHPGSPVYARTVAEEGECVISVEKSSGSGRYDRVVHMIEESEKLKSTAEDKASRMADRLVPYTLGGTALTYLLTRNVTKMLSVLMVDFSCALKLAIPIAVLSAMRESSGHHISVKGGRFLEAVAKADTIVFDKTGTLTYATPTVAAVICIHDPLRREAREAVKALHESGFTNVVMMTGDNRRTAETVAAEVGVDAVYAEVLPEDKAAFIRQEKAKGHTVIMVGDGVNDSPALSEADAGIAISTGAAIAREIADITVSSEDLFALVTLCRLGEALMKRIHGSYRFIVGFNLTLIALGVAGVLPPTTSALLHNGSTLGISLRNMTDLLDDEENTQK